MPDTPPRQLVRFRVARLLFAVYIGGACAACVDIDWSTPPEVDASVVPTTPSAGPSTRSDAGSDVETEVPEPVDDVLMAPSPRWVRLTHAQWLQAAQDVLRLENVPQEVTLPPDPRVAGFLFDNHAASLQVDEVLLQAYQRAAERFAELVVQDDEAVARLISGSVGNDSDHARRVIEELGARAFRRPLQASERERYLDLYEEGTQSYPEMPGHRGGLRFLVEGFLLSPFFLYRSELGEKVEDTRVQLSSFEIAQRLSFLVTGTVPDAQLWSAAVSEDLLDPEVLREHAQRLLESEAGKQVIRGYHSQLFDFSKYQSLTSEGAPMLGQAALREAEQFVDHVYSEGGGVRELLTERTTFVDATLASLYGVDPPSGAKVERRELSASRRAGLLTRVGFLATNATSEHPDPIHRGVFVLRRVTCQPVAAPPDAVPPLPPIGARTNREAVAEHTERSPGCAACHSKLINPFGFAFENYDALGRFREQDNGFEVDSNVKPVIDGEQRAVANAVELSEVLSESPGVHRCYSRHLVEFALGRTVTTHDTELLEELEHQSMNESGSIAELLLKVIISPSFRYRSTQEMP